MTITSLTLTAYFCIISEKEQHGFVEHWLIASSILDLIKFAAKCFNSRQEVHGTYADFYIIFNSFNGNILFSNFQLNHHRTSDQICLYRSITGIIRRHGYIYWNKIWLETVPPFHMRWMIWFYVELREEGVQHSFPQSIVVWSIKQKMPISTFQISQSQSGRISGSGRAD